MSSDIQVNLSSNSEVHFDWVKSLVEAAADRFCREHGGAKVFMDGALVHEVAARVSVTLREYNMSGQKVGGMATSFELPNYFKEAGHVAYWLVRMKPLRMASYNFMSKALSSAGINVEEEILSRAFLVTSSERPLPLNEYCALTVANSIIVRSERRLLSDHTNGMDALDAKSIREAFGDLRKQSKARAQIMADKVIDSLRYDTHSPNSLAVLFEAMIGTGFRFPDEEQDIASDIYASNHAAVN
jgi:hypothetical protein